MLIIDDNLKSLMIQHLIVENPEKILTITAFHFH